MDGLAARGGGGRGALRAGAPDGRGREDSRVRQFVRAASPYLLVAASLRIASYVEDAVGVESFLTQQVNRSGKRTVFTPHLGLETEAVPQWLKVRAGSYYEPTRFETSRARLHGTAGVDVRLFPWNGLGIWPDDYLWRIGLSMDVASRFFTWGVSLGGWYPREPTK